MKKYHIILNPVAGKGASGQALPQIKERLDQLGVAYDLTITYRPWHAAEIARQSVEAGYGALVSVGGDGTMNEVLNGLMIAREMGLGDAALGVIPIGRGNDFAYGMGAPLDMESACLALAGGHTRRVVIGRVTGGDSPGGRFFGNGVGIGFDTVVGFEAAKLKKVTGFAAYLVGALRTMFLYYNAPLLKIELDNQVIQQPALMLSIMNGRRMGGGFMMAPESVQGDQLLDLCLVSRIHRLFLLPMIVRFMKGTQASHRLVRMLRSNRIKVTAISGTLPVHADGETICTEGKYLEVELMPQQVDLIVNAQPQNGAA